MNTIKNRNKFRLTRLVLLKFPYVLKLLSIFRKPKKKILVIKLDAIGDYVLFRNYLEVLKNSKKFKGYEIDLLGNTIWKDLALTYDKPFISDFIFTDPFSLLEKPLQALITGWKLFRNNYEIVLQPTYSRTLIADGLAALTGAKKIIGFESDNELLYQKYKRKTDKFYSQKLQLPASVIFEFERSRYFFQQIINDSIPLKKPFLPVKRIESNYIIIFPGAGYIKREWGIEKFLSLVKLIIEHTDYNLIFAGGKSELHYEIQLNELSSEKVTSQIGKTTLTELIELIANARCVISNDTSAIHIAAACNTPAICIHGVAHYERFIPYPKDLTNDILFVYEKMPCFNCNWNCIFETKSNEPYPCIAINSVEQVWSAFTKLIAEENR